MQVLILIPFWIGLAWLCGWLAKERGRDAARWFVLALIFGPLALLAAGLAPRRTLAKSRKSKRGLWFILGIVLVAGVIALIYIPEPAPEPIMSNIMSDSTNPEAEIAHLEQLWNQHNWHSPIALRLATLYDEQGQPGKAVFYYREFLRTDTTTMGWEVRLDLARVLFGMNKPDEARTELKWILDRYPDHPGALYNMGAIEANTGNRDEAFRLWKKAAAGPADDPSVKLALQGLQQLNAQTTP